MLRTLVFGVGVVVLASALTLCGVATASGDAIPPSPTRWVTDTVGFISPATRDQLDAKLAQYNRATGHQVIVWIGDTTGDVPLEDWTIQAFTKWKVGRKGLDDGLTLFIFAHDRKLRIEVGYGLEDKVPDVIASRIIRETIVPLIKAGDHDQAVSAGVDQIIAAIGGHPPPTQRPAAQERGSSIFALLSVLPFVAFWFFVLILIIRSRGHAGWAAYGIASSGGFWGSGSSSSSGGFGGGDFGGGGFSGGGGGGGGGGASGGW